MKAVNSRSSSSENSDDVFVVFWGFIRPDYQGFESLDHSESNGNRCNLKIDFFYLSCAFPV